MLKDAKLVRKIGSMPPKAMILLTLGFAKMLRDNYGMTDDDLNNMITASIEQTKKLGDKHGQRADSRGNTLQD